MRRVWATTHRLTGFLRLPDGAGKRASEFTVAPGESVTFIADAYFDGPRSFAEAEGADLLRVTLSVDGREERHESRDLVMRQQP